MAASSISVARLGALLELDLTNYRRGLATAKTEGDSFAKSFKSSLSGAFTGPDSTKANITTFLRDVRAGRVSMADLKDTATATGSAIKSAFGTAANGGVKLFQSGLGAAANGVKTVLGGIKGALADVFRGFSIGLGIVSFQALGRAISDVIGFIPDLIKKSEAYGNQVDQIADATGATAEASSKLAGTLQYLGAPMGSIVNLLGQMSRNLDQNEARLNSLGVQTRDTSGALLNQVQILENARQAFQNYGDGTAKAAIIAREFGRGGLQVLIDYLKLTDDQAAKITEDLQKQGLILTESQRNLAEAATREGNRFQNTLTGLGTTLFTIVGPQINAFFSNLTDTIETHVEDIKNAVGSAISFILGLVSSLTGALGGVGSFSDSIEAAQGVTSPYSAKLLQLNIELADLKDKQTGAADATDTAKKALDNQIASIEKEIDALKAQDHAQQIVFDRQIAGLSRVYQLRLDALDLADKEREAAKQQADLDERLRQAKIDLFEAQAQLRADTLAGKSPDQDLLTIADKQRAVVEAQQAIAENARQTAEDQQRAQLESTKAYIDSIGELLDKAENKRAALNTLKRRQAVLEARQAAQLAAGDTGGAADTGARLEAIKTAEARAQQEIRNGVAQTALERQKTLLEQEKAAIKSVTDTTNAEAIRQTEITIAELDKQQKAWDRLTDRQKAQLTGVNEQITDPKTGLSGAFESARKAGVDAGNGIRDAFKEVADAINGVLTVLGDIAKSDAFRILFVEGPFKTPTPSGTLAGPERAANAPEKTYGTKGAKSELGSLLREIWDRYIGDPGGLFLGHPPSHAAGGWLNKPGLFMGAERGREYVLDHALSEKLDAFFSIPRMPAMAMAAGGPATGQPVIIRVEVGGNKLIDYIDENLAYRRR